MTNQLITTAVADSKKPASEPNLLTMPVAFLAFFIFLCVLIALATYSLTHNPELVNAIPFSTT
jgi:hypothetical protein